MSKYYKKELKDFKIGDPVIINDDTSYVTSINIRGDIITLVLSGVCNHTGDKESTIITYGTPKRIRRTKEQIEEHKKIKLEVLKEEEKTKQELKDNNVQYQQFVKAEGIDIDLKNFKKVAVESIVVGDFIKRARGNKVEKVLKTEDIEKYIYIEGWMGFKRNSEKDWNCIPKGCYIYKYKILNQDKMPI